MRKLPINKVGTVEPREDGGVDCSGWGFAPSELAGADLTVSIEPVDGTLGGWTAFELHAIAHGVPCDCPIGRADQTEG